MIEHRRRQYCVGHLGTIHVCRVGITHDRHADRNVISRLEQPGGDLQRRTFDSIRHNMPVQTSSAGCGRTGHQQHSAGFRRIKRRAAQKHTAVIHVVDVKRDFEISKFEWQAVVSEW